MKWEAWMGRFSQDEVPITLPRFKVDYTARHTLQKSLAAMGMGVAFDRMKADFRDMCSTSDNVYISEVTHKTVLDVDEEGTEAAAATSTEATPAGIAMPGSEMVVDHPFFCAIRDNKTGELLFMGAITDPR
jgi:serpin B